ncbi:hypothetical protein [Rugamonas sp. DEMB1]|uniref:hypothetical protein n=1 Tax=Rugamonas sp. DEMB1 TaxID=3039386 RepID=UPI00244714A3|nr:hypothetical protein [Rugamonas sp. DEMB1]WGG53282.1 hypothetical protein QC826_14920 [Rugamonas sp. DEMB1]
MSILDKLRRMLGLPPVLRYGKSGPALDPTKTYEFTFVANFADERGAALCAMALENTSLASKVQGLANGRWNAEFTITAKADAEKMFRLGDAIHDAAETNGGKVLLTTVGATRTTSDAT